LGFGKLFQAKQTLSRLASIPFEYSLHRKLAILESLSKGVFSNFQITPFDAIDAIDAVVALVTVDASAIFPHSNILTFKHSIIQKFP